MTWLCLDIEGGHGGSSRSLYHALEARGADAPAVEVWLRRAGPIEKRYADIDVPTQRTPEMPRLTVVTKLSRNLWGRLVFQRAWAASGDFRRRLEAKARIATGVHFNHESLHFLAAWLATRKTGATLTGHVRTRPPANGFARAQARRYAGATAGLAFITENEATHLTALAGAPARGRVIYNPVARSTGSPEPHPGVPRDGRFTVASISNFALVRGTDRLIPIAAHLATRGRRDIRIVVAGDMALPRSAQRALGTTAVTLETVARERELSEFFVFLGHVSEPERVLTACDCLLKPTPEANPWGRDVLEAMAFGRPAVTVGAYQRFVEHDVTGWLEPDATPSALADALIALADAPERRAALGQAAQARVAALCDPKRQADALISFWNDARSGALSPCAG